MKYLVSLLILFLFLGTYSFQTAAQSGGRVPVIVELFTSEGCSTCPPADKYLQRLIQEQPFPDVEIIAMSEHVDYWNGPEWVDKFSSSQFNDRQKYYAEFFKRTSIFTPQLVVDGTLEITGKNATQVLSEIGKTQKVEVSLKIKKVNADSVLLSIGIGHLRTIPNADKVTAFVAVAENKLASNVSGGENNGRKMEHTAVVRYLKALSEVNGGEKDLLAEVELGKDWRRENLSVIAFIQQTQGRRILGVAKVNPKW
jgi:hypothetical protein